MTVVAHHSFYVEQVRDVTVVSFKVTSVIGSNFDRVSEELFELVEFLKLTSDPIQVVLDLKSLRQIDDWGLAMLRAFSETIATDGGAVILSRLSQGVVDAIAETGMQTTFCVCDTCIDAIAVFTAESQQPSQSPSRIFAAMTAAIQ